MEPTKSRKVKRIRQAEVIVVTIPIVLTIDVTREDGKLLVGVSGGPFPVVVSDPVDDSSDPRRPG